MRGIKPVCEGCPDRIPDLRTNNIPAMSLYLKASNCLRYISGMERIYVSGIDWVNLKTIAELEQIPITKSMMKRLLLIENLLIEESNNERSKDTN